MKTETRLSESQRDVLLRLWAFTPPRGVLTWVEIPLGAPSTMLALTRAGLIETRVGRHSVRCRFTHAGEKVARGLADARDERALSERRQAGVLEAREPSLLARKLAAAVLNRYFVDSGVWINGAPQTESMRTLAKLLDDAGLDVLVEQDALLAEMFQPHALQHFREARELGTDYATCPMRVDTFTKLRRVSQQAARVTGRKSKPDDPRHSPAPQGVRLTEIDAVLGEMRAARDAADAANEVRLRVGVDDLREWIVRLAGAIVEKPS